MLLNLQNKSFENGSLNQQNMSEQTNLQNYSLSEDPNTGQLLNTASNDNQDTLQMQLQIMGYIVRSKFSDHRVIAGRMDSSKSDFLKQISKLKEEEYVN